MNSRFRASPERPVRMYVNDFDRNGMVEQVIGVHIGERMYPMALRHDLVSQMPGLKKRYLKYDSYKDQTIEDIFTPEQLSSAVQLNAYVLASSVLLNLGDGQFELQPLPIEAQFAPMYGIIAKDFDGDGHTDILSAGNFFSAKPEVGRYDACYGLWLRGQGQGSFAPVRARASGFRIDGEIRDLVLLRQRNRRLVLVARNNDRMQIFEY